MVNWQYKLKWIRSLDDLPPDAYGFTYCIRFPDNKMYIGKKNLWSIRSLAVLKSGKERKGHIEFFNVNRNHKRIQMERVRYESDWKFYCGSINYHLLPTSRKILDIAYNSLELTYLEAKRIFEYDAILSQDYLNDNILGKFYSRNFGVKK